ncbi:SIR2 family NAD-dependent protein deacylase [Gracilimonas mengyeensis]|uniref:NAD-dependent protein deacylase n=1 Tax=Gracilimonas mengyeensis TaxID=1302730 RepID=A0A521B4J8_9BACT|nr:NAD-dependent deacylase [Gracilimonas mengyeensis]SMO41961.1 NAD-dependent deacetylase [Gracilimonas mengyeensis]
MPDTKIVVITGAGVSAESGLATFRDAGGLWEGYDINEVASIEGWRKDPENVLSFYNLRRKQAAKAEPNEAHLALAELEDHYDVSIVTQNVDDLHERAGSNQVLHLHGELKKVRSINDPSLIKDIGSDAIEMGDVAEDGGQLRPHVVWFGEMVPMIEPAAEEVSTADILIVIGTSLVVYPAAGLIDYARPNIPKYIVDPSDPQLYDREDWHHYKENAGTGVRKLADKLIKEKTNNGE